MNDREIKMSYEEYKETTKDILKDMFKTKEDYESKIENLASEIIPDNKICGYYIILEYCYKKIKENDTNLKNGFAKDLSSLSKPTT